MDDASFQDVVAYANLDQSVGVVVVMEVEYSNWMAEVLLDKRNQELPENETIEIREMKVN